MAKKKKRYQKAMSDSSDEEIFDGISTLYGPAAHQGGNSKGTCTQRSVSPPAMGHSPSGQEDVTDPPVTCHRPNGQKVATPRILVPRGV